LAAGQCPATAIEFQKILDQSSIVRRSLPALNVVNFKFPRSLAVWRRTGDKRFLFFSKATAGTRPTTFRSCRCLITWYQFGVKWRQLCRLLPVHTSHKSFALCNMESRFSMAWKRSSVRSRSGPPNNPSKIKRMPEAEHSLPSMTLCHFVSRVQKACAGWSTARLPGSPVYRHPWW
jgi:hypothetical protein